MLIVFDENILGTISARSAGPARCVHDHVYVWGAIETMIMLIFTTQSIGISHM